MVQRTYSTGLAQVLSICLGATQLIGASPGATDLPLLLKRGVERGYPGIAFLAQSSDGTIRSASAGYSDLENHTPMRV